MSAINTTYNTRTTPNYYSQKNTQTPTSQQPQKKNNNKLIIGTTAGLAILGGALLLTKNKNKKNINKEIQNTIDLQNLKESVIEFLNTAPKTLAEGCKGKVYKVDNYVIKVGKEAKHNFKEEAELLKKLPENFKSGQKYVGYFEDKKYGSILVSNFVEGESKALEGENFNKFLNVVLEHDKSGILHGDLNKGNWKINKNNEINFIDYGEGKLFSQKDETLSIYPKFIPNSNIINFEQNGIQDCMLEWEKNGNDLKSMFTDYLKEKSQFHKKHADFLQETTPEKKEAIKYEENLSKVLSNPTDKIIQNELHRMQTLNALENTDTAVTILHIPQDAIKGWGKTVEFSNKFKDFTQEQLQKTLNSDEQTYFSNQKNIAEQFTKELSNWANNSTEWLSGLKNKNTNEIDDDLSKRLKSNWDKVNQSPTIINFTDKFNF